MVIDKNGYVKTASSVTRWRRRGLAESCSDIFSRTLVKNEKSRGTRLTLKRIVMQIALIFMVAWSISAPPCLHAQETESITHYILLVDATKSFRGLWGSSYEEQIEGYVRIIRAALNTNSLPPSDAKEKITFRANTDIVSLVFFYFPFSENRKFSGGKYFHTSAELASFQNLSDVENNIRQFLQQKPFIGPAFSPLRTAESTVFPYLCSQFQENKWPRSEKIIDKIILVSIGDQDISEDDVDNFDDQKERKQYIGWQKNFERNFKKLPLDNGYYLYNAKTDRVQQWDSLPPPNTTNAYLKYYKIIPTQLDTSFLESTSSQCALTRVAEKMDQERIKYSWRGKSGLHWSSTYPNADVQWTFNPSVDGDSDWKPRQKKGVSTDDVYITDLKNQQESWIQISDPTENNGTFKSTIYYRGVVDLDTISSTLPYPYKYRHYSNQKKIDYYAEKSEVDITDKTLGDLLEDKSFCQEVTQFIHDVEKQARRNISDLDATTVKKVRKFMEDKGKIWIRNFLIILFSALLVAIGLVLYYLKYRRHPQIDVTMEKDNENTISCHFSDTQKESQTVALFDINNLRTFLSPHQAKSPFDLSMTFKIQHDLKEEDILEYNLAELFSITNFQGEIEYAMTQEADTLKVYIPETCASDKLRLVLHPQKIEDLSTPHIEDKTIAFTVTLVTISAVFKKNRKTVPMKKEKIWPPLRFQLLLMPQNLKHEVTIEPVFEENQTVLDFDPDAEQYSIPYSAKLTLRKLFKITMENKSFKSFSQTLVGEISGKAYENGSLMDSGLFFYLDKNKSSNQTMVSLAKSYKLSLKANESLVIYCYLQFTDFQDNPLEPRNFQIQFYFNDEKIEKGSANLVVKRSKERTEALIEILDQGYPALPEKDGRLQVNDQNQVVIHENSINSLNWSTRVTLPDPKLFKEYEPTELFALRLKNGCRTHTGYYQWRVDNMRAIKNGSLQYEDKYEDQIISIMSAEKTGRIADNEEAEELIIFFLYPGNGKIDLTSYHVSFDVQFTLFIDFFPEGPSTHPVIKKQLNVVFTCQGIHHVIPNYLVVDFGTSAIAAANSEFTEGEETEQVTNLLNLKSSSSLLPSESGLLPSILSLNKDTVIDSQEYVNLPAEKRLISINPELLLTSVKLMILESGGEISLPKNFSYLDQNNNPVTGGNIKLESLLKSAYKQLRHGYIDTKNVDYKKLVFTCPNVYTKSHKQFLTDLLTEVFIRPTEGVHRENIELVSESDAVLYYYLKKRAGDENKPSLEDIAIFDIGGGTMDITLAVVEWEKDKFYPISVNVKKRDGIALAGEVLDKAIALQVHSILEEYEPKFAKPTQEPSSKPGDDLDVGKVFRTEAKNQSFGEPIFPSPIKNDLHTDSIQNLPEEQSGFVYYNRIAGDARLVDEKFRSDLISVMFNFKFEYILQFKKEIFRSGDNSWVKICIGKNNTIGGLCLVKEKRIPLEFSQKGASFHAYLQSENDFLFLYLKKSEWLALPYLIRFKSLFREKIQRFVDSIKEENNPKNITVILSGRTSLWPAIPAIIQNIFGHEPVDIWKKEPGERALDLKRSVIEGALQKVFYWPQINYDSVKTSGVPAVNYQLRPKEWKCIPLSTGESVEIDLNNSPFFQLGILTDLAFTPFMNCNHLSRTQYCRKVFTVRVHTKDDDNEIGYNFRIQSDRYRDTFCKVVPEPKSGGAMVEHRGLWPVRSIQLPEVSAEEFNEHI